MTALYVPPTGETDPKKQNQSIQLIGGVTSTNTANIATNTANIATNTTAIAALNSGLYPGTTTNNNATTGNIGEYISSSVAAGSAVSLVTGTAKDVTTISLTAGDWDVTGNVGFSVGATTTQTVLIGYIGLVSNTLPTAPNAGAYIQSAASFATGSVNVIPAGTLRVSIAGTTTVYLGALANFGVSTSAAYGFIRARRVR